MNPGENNIKPNDAIDFRPFDFSREGIKRMISKVIIGGIVLIFIFPLIGDYGTLLFPIGRDIILRFIVEVIGALFILLIYLDRSYLPKPNLTVWLFLIFWLISGITTILSTQPQFSLWGNIFRGQGFFSQTHIFFLFLIIVGFVKKIKQWEKIIWIAVGVGAIVSIITFFEYVINQNEAQSTLNNPNFLGMYLLFPIFLTVSLILNKENIKWRIILLSALILELVAAYSSNSRGTYGGIIIGFICIIATYKLLPIYRNFSKQIKITTVFLLAIGAVMVIGLLGKEIKAVDSFIKNPKAEQINSRLIDWFRIEYYQAAVKGIMEKPLTGFGLENYTVAFDRYYRGTLDNQEWENQWSDKTHNIFLEVGVTTGLLGLAAYLGIWLSVFILLIKKIIAYKLKQQPDNRYWMTVGLLSVFSAYLTNNQLTIESTTITAYSAIFLALAVFLCRSESIDTRDKRVINSGLWVGQEKVKLGIMAAILLIAVMTINNKYNIPELVANYRLNEGEQFFSQMDYSAGFNKFEDSLRVGNPAVSPYLRYRYGRMAVFYRENALVFSVETDRQTILRAIQLQEENAKNEWPIFTRNWVLAGKLTNILLEKSAEPIEKTQLKNQADSYFKKALELSSNHGIIYLEWA
ncbi:MAG: O-antigen ligase family protein, partial [bacterium]